MNIPIWFLAAMIPLTFLFLTGVTKYVILRRIEKLEDWVETTHEEKCMRVAVAASSDLKSILSGTEEKITLQINMMKENMVEKIDHIKEIVQLSLEKSNSP